jgi:hypothetical protein
MDLEINFEALEITSNQHNQMYWKIIPSKELHSHSLPLGTQQLCLRSFARPRAVAHLILNGLCVILDSKAILIGVIVKILSLNGRIQ